MTAPMPHRHDAKPLGRDVLAVLAESGAVLLMVGYCDGTVHIASDEDAIPDSAVAGILRNAADQADKAVHG